LRRHWLIGAADVAAARPFVASAPLTDLAISLGIARRTTATPLLGRGPQRQREHQRQSTG
jgi:hypothetical protein